MKVINILLILFIFSSLIYGCSEDVERENPLDAQNIRTNGVIPGVTAKAGDSQITLSWSNTSFSGVKEYKIYRAHLSPENFELIATVSVEETGKEETGKYTYTDKGLLNDVGDYYYRVSYVDSAGVETPDPNKPNKNLAVDWSTVHLTPSLAPPSPIVKVVEDTDLMVKLVWQGYSQIAPSDIAGFRVYIAPKAEKGQQQEPILVATIDDPKVEFYKDGNDYAKDIIGFTKDGISKLYKVTAYDKVGVESEAPILTGTSPNLPPNPPANFKGTFTPGLNTYSVRLDWARSPEPDVIGYKVYALLPDGTSEFKAWKTGNDTTITITDPYILVDDAETVKQYFVTAYDDTKKPNDINDESAPSALVPPSILAP